MLDVWWWWGCLGLGFWLFVRFVRTRGGLLSDEEAIGRDMIRVWWRSSTGLRGCDNLKSVCIIVRRFAEIANNDNDMGSVRPSHYDPMVPSRRGARVPTRKERESLCSTK